jgi:hypothetical protein
MHRFFEMKFNSLVVQTFGRLSGIRAFLEVLDRALPDAEWKDNEALKVQAEEQAWEESDFDVERQILDERFRFWLPRFSSYSVVTLLFTVLETQLTVCARVAAKQKGSSFLPGDVRGQGVEAAVLFLKRVGAFDARQDPAWQTICDVRDLRHLIVHRAGTKGESEEHRRTAQRLAAAYRGRIEFPDSAWSWYGEVWIAIPLCRDFITTVERFFDRVFEALGLPPRYEARVAKR